MHARLLAKCLVSPFVLDLITFTEAIALIILLVHQTYVPHHAHLDFSPLWTHFTFWFSSIKAPRKVSLWKSTWDPFYLPACLPVCLSNSFLLLNKYILILTFIFTKLYSSILENTNSYLHLAGLGVSFTYVTMNGGREKEMLENRVSALQNESCRNGW